MKAYVLTVKGSGRLVDGKLPAYPSCLPDYELVYAITPNDSIKIPEWFRSLANPKSVAGAWCCYLSHLNMYKNHLDKYPEEDLLSLEDDVRFLPGFDTLYTKFMSIVPDDWGAIWFGGLHLGLSKEVLPGILKCDHMANTECILINHKLLPVIVDYLEKEHTSRPWQDQVVSSSCKVMPHYSPIYNFAWQQDNIYSDIEKKIVKHDNVFNFKYIDVDNNIVTSDMSKLLTYL